MHSTNTSKHSRKIRFQAKNRYTNSHTRSTDKRTWLAYMHCTIPFFLIANSAQHNADLNAITRLCHEMAEFNLTDHSSLYNSLIHLFLKRRDLSSCHALFDNMKQRHVQPTVHTYSLMLKVYGWQRDIDGMSKLLDDMYSRNISPDTGIVSVLVFGLCRQREFDLARDFVNKVFQSSGGDAWLLGIKMREQLLKNIDQAQQKRCKVVRARATWRKNVKNKRRKKA
ncbi:hypothetical protein BJV82DRAFT_592772 [Fennellomyces sp. T-0311]|nr:hypothetical protein BJV82DRAFT_592772 [Fennellomyces sp. T-0311]